jgi:2-C-methyl-D-erythritol 2,4-cyclodiphosphate synthase
MVKCAIGQDSHAFETDDSRKPLMLGGVKIENGQGLKANSDGDVVLHALTNAISGISGVNILGDRADDMCLKQGITDSRAYVQEALKTLSAYTISHVSISIECSVPKLAPYIDVMRKEIAGMMSIGLQDVGITATTGEAMTAFGKGEGVKAMVVVTARN